MERATLCHRPSADKLCVPERAQRIVDALYRYLADEYTCRALCFCVNKKHADFMASQLQKYGFSVQSLTSDTPQPQRNVTLNKSDKDFSPSTQYDDYIINKDYFHWQSKNTDSHYNRGGKIYTEQPQRHNMVVLFVREKKKDGFGNTCPFHCFGLVDYAYSHGNFPMNITWKQEKPVMPQYLKVV